MRAFGFCCDEFASDCKECVVFVEGAAAGFLAGVFTTGCFCEAGLFLVTVVLLDAGGLTVAGDFETVDLAADELLVEVVLFPEITTVLPTTFDE